MALTALHYNYKNREEPVTTTSIPQS